MSETRGHCRAAEVHRAGGRLATTHVKQMGGVRGVGAGSGGGAITLGLLAQHSSSQWSPASLPRALGEEAVSPDLRTKRNDKFLSSKLDDYLVLRLSTY